MSDFHVPVPSDPAGSIPAPAGSIPAPAGSIPASRAGVAAAAESEEDLSLPPCRLRPFRSPSRSRLPEWSRSGALIFRRGTSFPDDAGPLDFDADGAFRPALLVEDAYATLPILPGVVVLSARTALAGRLSMEEDGGVGVSAPGLMRLRLEDGRSWAVGVLEGDLVRSHALGWRAAARKAEAWRGIGRRSLLAGSPLRDGVLRAVKADPDTIPLCAAEAQGRVPVPCLAQVVRGFVQHAVRMARLAAAGEDV